MNDRRWRGEAVVDLHYWTTPNGSKIIIALEELGLPYQIVPVNISAGEQFRPEFLHISPNNRILAIVDHAPGGGVESLAVFESGAIADIACYPWIRLHEHQGQDLSQFPHIERWFGMLSTRPAIIRACEIAARVDTIPTVTEASKQYLFGKTAASITAEG
jgi:glutathione S-transferase